MPAFYLHAPLWFLSFVGDTIFGCRLVIFTDAVERYSSVFSAHLALQTNASSRCVDGFCGSADSGIAIENFNYDDVLTKESISSQRPILTRFFIFRQYLRLHSECKGVLVTDSRWLPLHCSYALCRPPCSVRLLQPHPRLVLIPCTEM